jgi:putative transposase
MREAHEIGERRACMTLGVDRSAVRYRSCRPEDPELRARLRSLAGERRRFGYRRLGLLLSREGVRLNHKKLRRIYSEERLRCAAVAAANGRWAPERRSHCRMG